MVSRKIETLNSKTGLPVLQVAHEGRKLFIHSKYDPVKEADQILRKYEEEIDQFNHILFYGVGFGYHVKSFMERYPDKIVSTYEPIVEVAAACTAAVADTKLRISHLKYAFVENEPEDMERHLYTFSNHLSQKVLLIIHPAYERFLQDEVFRFIGKFKEIVEEKKNILNINTVFSRRWTINSLMNLPSTYENPNFLLEHEDTFRDKPVILAAAGPSLSEEMDNLRLIKEQGIAYIFAVGSANKALIAQGIYPDAVFTYDPQAHNYTVFQPIIDGNIQSIPLIYGTSVGFETIERYPGPKLHFLTSQDKITQQFHETRLPIIDDAYSISIVTLELLYRLQVKKIILVGQNFGFKNDLFYPEEISRYDKTKREVSDARIQKGDLINSFTVPSVYGEEVVTNKGFNNMRVLMEEYIAKNPQIPVVNTTRGGAAIAGTTYKPLLQLIEQELTESVVVKDWFRHGEALPMSTQTINELKRLQRAIMSYIQQNEDLFKHFYDIERTIDRLNINQIQQRLKKLDELMRKLTTNKFYDIVIRPITEDFFERLQNEVEIMREMDPTKEKLINAVNLFARYLHICRDSYKEVMPMIQTVISPAFLKETDKKELVATSGVFQYKGEWEKKNPSKEQIPADLTEEEKGAWYERKRLEDKIDLPILSVRTTETNSSFTFNFSGTSLSIYGTNHSKGILRLRVIIDNKITNVIVKDKIDEELYGSFMRQQLFQTTNLKDDLHKVTIEVTSNNSDFSFQGIEIDKIGRAYHVHEVTTVDELEVGKRIRCHYEATYNTVGEFSGLGEGVGALLPVEASAEPDGDFYFIMVDEVDGEKKLIADRNLQNYISFTNLIVGLKKQSTIKEYANTTVRMLNVSEDTEGTDEWLMYLQDSDFDGVSFSKDELTWHQERNVDEGRGLYSFIRYENGEPGVYSKYYHTEQEIINENRNVRVTAINSNKLWGFRPIVIIC